MIENITIKDLQKIMNILKTDESNTVEHNGEEIRIVILQRGWVVIGKYYKVGSKCWVESGYIIRNWGTKKGLGQLAIEGMQEETILDSISKTEFHELTIVASIICDKSKWNEICK